ncbi:MAG: hypothetical protein ACOX5R_00525 [bacterium]|jgi:hypothetical protein
MVIRRREKHIWGALLAVVFASTGAMAQTTYVFQENLNGYTGTSDTYFQTGDAAAIHARFMVMRPSGSGMLVTAA